MTQSVLKIELCKENIPSHYTKATKFFSRKHAQF